LVIYSLVFVMAAWLLLPTVWMLLTSLKQPADVATNPPTFVFRPTLDNYIAVLTRPQFFTFALQTLIVATTTAAVAVPFGALAAYGIARFRAGGLPFFFLLVFVQALPPVVLGLPLFVMYRQIGLADTVQGLVLSYTTFALPFAIWLLIAFFEDIPVDLEEAALVDGCGRWGAFVRIVLPLVRPGLAVTGILIFIGGWNQFFFALVLAGETVRTLPLVGSEFISTYTVEWGQVAAFGSLLLLLPLGVVLVLQRHIVRGLTFGAVKG